MRIYFFLNLPKTFVNLLVKSQSLNILKWIFLSLTVFTQSIAFAGQEACFAVETNPETGQKFSTTDEFEKFQESWENQSPGLANPIQLLMAYNVYKKEKDFAVSLGSDKLAHCFLGCRISQETSYHTSDYVGWLKEMRDLTDCNPNSFFDENDYRATIRGGLLGNSQPDASSCQRACLQIYD